MTPDRGKRRGLRLLPVRRPDPVLTRDEMNFTAERLRHYIAWAEAEMADKKVSESVIRGRMTACDALAKFYEAGAWGPS